MTVAVESESVETFGAEDEVTAILNNKSAGSSDSLRQDRATVTGIGSGVSFENNYESSQQLQPNNGLLESEVQTSKSNNFGSTAKISDNKLELLATIILWISFPVFSFILSYLLFNEAALPGGIIFSVLVLEFFGIAVGFVFSKIKLPPLLGMLTFGIFVRNVSYFNSAVVVSSDVSSVLRQIALVVILIRAGLGLDLTALLKLKGVVIRLAFLPCLAEAIVIGIVTHFILGFPWMWGLLLGFVLAAVTPAVVVPSLLVLQEKGYGVKKGIPTLVIAASSVDDILAISFFGVTLGFALSQGSLVKSLVQGPIELVIGIGFGVLMGLLLGLPYTNYKKDWEFVTIIRTFFLLAVGIVGVLGSQYIEYPGAGALGCLLAAFIAGVHWRRKNVLQDNDALCWNMSFLWFIFQPLLFSLIGREINLHSLDGRVVGLGLLCVSIALVARLIVSFMAVCGAELNVKEKLFVAISWIPKATVQAAIGPVALDTARKLGSGEEAERLGLEVLTIAVLVILITAPVGAIAIAIMGPKLLSKNVKNDESKNREDDDVEI